MLFDVTPICAYRFAGSLLRNNRLRLLLCAAAVAIIRTAPVFAAEPEIPSNPERRCYEDVICVDEHQAQDGVIRFELVNLRNTELTITYDLELTNLSADQTLPRTIVVESGGTAHVATVTRRNPRIESKYRFSYRWLWGRADTRHDDNYVYELPVPPGETCRVTQGYDGRFSHNGKNAIDFAMPVGTPVYAARGGAVIAADDSNLPPASGRGSRRDRNSANYLLVRHDDATIGGYFHLDHAGISVQVGQRISAGQFIARSGNTGFTTGPHLHFEVTSPLDGTEAISYPVFFRTGEAVASILHGGNTVIKPLPDSDTSTSETPLTPLPLPVNQLPVT